MTCEPDPSVVSFLPGLGLTKTTVLESMRTLSYFRLDTLTLVMIPASYVQLTFSGLKQVIHDQTKQNRYQTAPLSVYIHNLMFVFIFDQVF